MEGETEHSRLCRLIEAADQLADRLDRLSSRALGRGLTRDTNRDAAPRPVLTGYPMALDYLDGVLTCIAARVDELDPLA